MSPTTGIKPVYFPIPGDRKTDWLYACEPNLISDKLLCKFEFYIDRKHLEHFVVT